MAMVATPIGKSSDDTNDEVRPIVSPHVTIEGVNDLVTWHTSWSANAGRVLPTSCVNARSLGAGGLEPGWVAGEHSGPTSLHIFN
ncbi:hypothetical protein KI387_014287, partial [Taxus chinensis]